MCQLGSVNPSEAANVADEHGELYFCGIRPLTPECRVVAERDPLKTVPTGGETRSTGVPNCDKNAEKLRSKL